MNRQRFIDRDLSVEGDVRAQNLAAALAQQCDPDFLEALLHGKAALDEFGGQIYLAAARDRFLVNNAGDFLVDDEGNFIVAEKGDRSRWLSYGYVFHYGSKPTIRRLQTDEEAEEFEAPTEVEEEQPTVDLEPVPVEA